MPLGTRAGIFFAVTNYRFRYPLMTHTVAAVTWVQRILEGAPKYAASQNRPDFPYADYAHPLGLGGIRVETPEAVAAAWEQAPSADRQVILDMVTDPNVPPPPKWWIGVVPKTAEH